VAWADAHVVDGAVNGTATLVRTSATALRKSQGGFVRAYAAIIALGSIAVLAWFVFRGIVG
jgi:NADH-quinone oxidoreductase subunit L